ncbi:TPA: hypothetical protein ACX3DE_001234 [Vibrio parahaemolyticus]|nr:hypothetical protein [Vibrio parahaemolyticus]HCG8572767.1 hypothetical protein [Vibrio parahaemolyticus]
MYASPKGATKIAAAQQRTIVKAFTVSINTALTKKTLLPITNSTILSYTNLEYGYNRVLTVNTAIVAMLSSCPFFVAALKKTAAINAPKMYCLTKYDVLRPPKVHFTNSFIISSASMK